MRLNIQEIINRIFWNPQLSIRCCHCLSAAKYQKAPYYRFTKIPTQVLPPFAKSLGENVSNVFNLLISLAHCHCFGCSANWSLCSQTVRNSEVRNGPLFRVGDRMGQDRQRRCTEAMTIDDKFLWSVLFLIIKWIVLQTQCRHAPFVIILVIMKIRESWRIPTTSLGKTQKMDHHPEEMNIYRWE